MPPNRACRGCRIASADGPADTWRIGVEITLVVTGARRVAPKVKRHGGQRLCAHQLTHRISEWAPKVIEGLHRTTQHPALHVTGILGQRAVTPHKSTREISTARYIAPPQALLRLACCGVYGCHGGIAPSLRICTEWRTGAAPRAQGRQVATLG